MNLGVWLAPLLRKLLARIKVGDYVDFGKFPPVAGVAGQEPLDKDLEERV